MVNKDRLRQRWQHLLTVYVAVTVLICVAWKASTHVNDSNVSSLQPSSQSEGKNDVIRTNLVDQSLTTPSGSSTPPIEPKIVNNEILNYLKEEEARCLQANSEGVLADRKSACPCVPPGLVGRLKTDTSDDPNGWDGILRHVTRGESEENYRGPSAATAASRVLIGGEWKPVHCTANVRLAVIIPCRDRESHLRVMLRHLYPVLQRQLAHFRIFVVEQNSPAIFNKAAMMNIGFLEAVKRFPSMNCVMFHDVDHLVEDDRTLMTCSDRPHHYAASMDEWNYRLIYTSAFGGVITMKPELFRKVNGYSLQYFGWGGEDDDMGDRVRQFTEVFRPPLELCRYTTIKHVEDGGNPRNDGRHGVMDKQHERYVNRSFDGISDIRYELNDVQLRPLYTWIHVNLDVTGLSTYPSHRRFSYQKLPGVTCNQATSGLGFGAYGGDISWITCRYLCDSELRSPCVGFIYKHVVHHLDSAATAGSTSTTSLPERARSTTADHELAMFGKPVQSQLGQTNGGETKNFKCVLMSTVCDLVAATGARRDTVTYLKDAIKI